MIIQQKYAAIAVKYTDARRKNQGVAFDDNYLEQYAGKLRELAQVRGIKEGDTLAVTTISYQKPLKKFNTRPSGRAAV